MTRQIIRTPDAPNSALFSQAITSPPDANVLQGPCQGFNYD
jgi:hypothetical protein